MITLNCEVVHMKVYETKSSIQSLYYLMTVDKNIGEDELVRFAKLAMNWTEKTLTLIRRALSSLARSIFHPESRMMITMM